MLNNSFYIDISRVHIAHECTIDTVHKCEYPEGRGSYGLVLALDGEAEYRFTDGRRSKIKAGEIILLGPRAAYRIWAGRGFKHYTVNFDVHGETSRGWLVDSEHLVLKPERPERYQQILKKTVALWSAKRACYEMLIISEVYVCLAMIHEEILGVSEDERLKTVKEYIHNNFNKEITLDTLAQLANMSVTSFRREWTGQYGVPPLKYRDSVRLLRAEEYLSYGYFDVSEVAERCGFEDVSYFSRFFKKHRGISPSEFRKKAFIL